MKKYIVFALASFLVPAFALAQGFTADVSYGMQGPAVLEVQEFLGSQGLYAGPYTGNFYSLTLAAVKRFQSAHGIPTTGYFGPLSRSAAQGIVAQESASNEVSTTTASIPNATGSVAQAQVITLPNGNVVSVAPDGTITTIYTAPQTPAPAPTPITPPITTVAPTQTTSVPNSQASTMTGTQPAQPTQPTPFQRTGTVTAKLVAQGNSFNVNDYRMLVATIQISNQSNEPIQFSNRRNWNDDIVVSNNTIDGYKPIFAATYRNVDLPNDTTGLQPGQNGNILLYVIVNPHQEGSFDLTIDQFDVVGVTSGDIFPIGGFPIALDPITISK